MAQIVKISASNKDKLSKGLQKEKCELYNIIPELYNARGKYQYYLWCIFFFW
jgi:hypothetical protein